MEQHSCSDLSGYDGLPIDIIVAAKFCEELRVPPASTEPGAPE